MSVITRDRALTILTDLIARPSVNPMERPWQGKEPVERQVADYIEGLFAPYGARLERQAVSAMHESLLLEIPGQTDQPGRLFESHMDTVPADDWPDRAFIPRVEGDTVYGRGACDDKGCLAAMILAALDLLETKTVPPRPVLFLAAGDEECGQTGIKYFRNTNRPVANAIFGEPTNLVPVVQHRGTIRWDITVHGKSAHTSRPELGVNAILGMVEVIQTLARCQEEARARYSSPLLPGPGLTVTMIHGGRTRNAVPDECTIAVDYRIVPGMDRQVVRDEVIRTLDQLGLKITHKPPHTNTPPLTTSPTDPFSLEVLEICRKAAGPHIELSGVPYGTDAAWISDRAPSLVLGPGSIVSAHAIDENIDINEVVACAQIYRDIMLLEA
jgi:acetylornithine deacetylase